MLFVKVAGQSGQELLLRLAIEGTQVSSIGMIRTPVKLIKLRPVAQLAERRSPKPQVGGSIPSWPARSGTSDGNKN